MSLFTILLGGELTPTPRLTAQVAGSRVVAADAGTRHAPTLGVTPELWVGDFDSVPDDLPAELAGVERLQFPAAKDKTDGELAVEQALKRGATELILIGAFGGPRLDHEFLHLTLAIRLMEQGVKVLLSSGAQEGIPLATTGQKSSTILPPSLFSRLLPPLTPPHKGEGGRDGAESPSPLWGGVRGGGEFEKSATASSFSYTDGTVFSIIAFDDLTGLTVTGARWPLDNFDMPFGSSRTISNEVQGDLNIRLKSGRAMLVAHPYPVSGF